MKYFLALFSLLMIGVLTVSAQESASEAILFCRSYENYAWTATKEGFFVDSSGKVFSFRFPREALGPLLLPPKSKKTTDSLRAEYDHNLRLIKTVSPQELAKMKALVPLVAMASYTPKVSNARDAGEELWLAFIVDDENKSYKTVKLKEDGDFVQNSVATAATTLVNWLDGLRK